MAPSFNGQDARLRIWESEFDSLGGHHFGAIAQRKGHRFPKPMIRVRLPVAPPFRPSGVMDKHGVLLTHRRRFESVEGLHSFVGVH